MEFVAPLGVSRAHLSNIENGKDEPGRELLEAVQVHYQVSLDWLRGKADDMQIRNRAADEQKLLDAFRRLPHDEQEMHLQIIERRARSLNPT